MRESIKVTGMNCQSCENGIKSKLGALDGVLEVEVRLIDDEVVVGFHPEKITLQKIESALGSLGYPPAGQKKQSNIGWNGFLKGLGYGLLPHVGCFAFILGSILGATVLMDLFEPLMNMRVCIAISLVFATLSCGLYLRKQGLFSMRGAQKKWKHLSMTYASTIGINVALFLFIFPMMANITLDAPAVVEGEVQNENENAMVELKVDIPCPGHARLISSNLRAIAGVHHVQFSFPDNFTVNYNPRETSKEEILHLEVFSEYAATVAKEDLPSGETIVLK